AYAKSGFALNLDNAQAIAQLCARLDGIPLAIELAAARARFISPQEMLTRFDRMLDLVAGGPQDRPPRQQTLRNAIQWSYDLLGGREQRVVRELGVFTGGFSPDAAREVCSDEGENDLPGVIESLLDKSLLRAREARKDEIARGFGYDILETIREFAHEQL